jgi:hypothetical protein
VIADGAKPRSKLETPGDRVVAPTTPPITLELPSSPASVTRVELRSSVWRLADSSSFFNRASVIGSMTSRACEWPAGSDIVVGENAKANRTNQLTFITYSITRRLNAECDKERKTGRVQTKMSAVGDQRTEVGGPIWAVGCRRSTRAKGPIHARRFWAPTVFQSESDRRGAHPQITPIERE